MSNSPSRRVIVFAILMLAMSAAAFAQFGVSITVGPPALPVYEQPPVPAQGYLWAPGYWAYGQDGYFFVPGTWVMAPQPGFLWTPGYWGWRGNAYAFNEGYWGPHVGFYGGINYGFGYFGHGFEGGRWDNGHFFYNRAVLNVNVDVIHNVYNTRVNETNVARVSFNGGSGGINARATAQEEAAAHERHIPAVAAQTEHIQAARSNPELRASANHGKPPIAATDKPGELKGGGAVAAREAGTVHEPARPESNAPRVNPAIHPSDLPRTERPATPSTGNPNLDKKYQQQQQKLQTKQDQERQKLQQKQDQDHQKLEKQKVDDAKKQQVEQKHQQQTQQLAQRHTQQQQQLQQRQQAAPHPAPSARPPKG
jgi:hypothetical protein